MGEASDRGFNRLRPIFAREVEEAGEEEDLSILVGLRPLLGVGLEVEKLSSCGGRRVWIATEEEEEGDPSIHLLTEHRRPRFAVMVLLVELSRDIATVVAAPAMGVAVSAAEAEPAAASVRPVLVVGETLLKKRIMFPAIQDLAGVK